MRFVFTGGGTGGHVYPGLSVAEALRADAPEMQAVYIGRSDGPEARLAPAAGLRFHGVPAAGVRGKSPLGTVRGVLRLTTGVAAASRLLGRLRPDAVFATGGYASVPVALAARARGIPVVVYLPDVYPGWAVRLLARIATRVGTTSEAALPHLPAGKSVVTGYPVRAEFFTLDRPTARGRLHLPPRVPVLLVSGGSSGSRDLNAAVAHHLPQFSRLAHVVHLCGQSHVEEFLKLRGRMKEELHDRYRPVAYLDDMPAALHAADLAVMRAGASTLGELPATGVPAVLVPGPFSDQARNAHFLEQRGAAMTLANDELDTLFPTVRDLLTRPDRLTAMRGAMRSLARPEAAAELARLVLEVAR